MNGTFCSRGQSHSLNFDHLPPGPWTSIDNNNNNNNNFTALHVLLDATCVPRSFPDIESVLRLLLRE